MPRTSAKPTLKGHGDPGASGRYRRDTWKGTAGPALTRCPPARSRSSDRAARHRAGGTTSCAGSRASCAVSSGSNKGQRDEICRCVLVEIHDLLRFQRRRIEYLDRRVSKEVQLLPVAAYRKSQSGWPGVQFLFLDYFMILNVPNPPF